MNTLPSFVELMSTLGLDNSAASDYSSSPGSTPPLSPQTPSSTVPRRVRSQSVPSVIVHPSGARYMLPGESRSSPADSEFERPAVYSSSPQLSPSPRLFRREDDVNVNIIDSTTDLAANTPISSYVRRRTPPDTARYACESPMPCALPTLPPLFSLYTLSLALPPPPDTDLKCLDGPCTRRAYRYGVRISTPPRSADLNDPYRRHGRYVAPIT